MQLAFGHLPDVALLDVDLTQREASIARVQAASGQEVHPGRRVPSGRRCSIWAMGVDALLAANVGVPANLNTTKLSIWLPPRRRPLKQQRRWPCGHGRAAAAARGQAHMGAYRAAKKCLAAADRGLVGRAEKWTASMSIARRLPCLITPDNRRRHARC